MSALLQNFSTPPNSEVAISTPPNSEVAISTPPNSEVTNVLKVKLHINIF